MALSNGLNYRTDDLVPNMGTPNNKNLLNPAFFSMYKLLMICEGTFESSHFMLMICDGFCYCCICERNSRRKMPALQIVVVLYPNQSVLKNA